MNTKTSIVATLGPASQQTETLDKLIGLGVSVFRLNFSHGTFETHQTTLEHINQARKSFPYCVAVMGDLSGPKIRIGQIEPGTSLTEGRTVKVMIGETLGNALAFTTTYADLIKDVQVGQRILLDDGQLVLKVKEKTPTHLVCQVVIGGPLSSRKGMNLPDTQLSTPAITPRDWQCVDWAIAHELDYLALSFVQRADEVRQLKDYLKQKGSRIKVIPKIEKPLAIENIESIIVAADGIMMARGDLGVEMDLAQVPLVQKRITALCRRLGKPVIIATQVLQSMIENFSPTRAEATDVANAVMEYADAVMLSGETAVGKYPVEAVRWLAHICRTTEAYMDSRSEPRPVIDTAPEQMEMQSIARASAAMLDEIKAACVVAWAHDTDDVRLLSKVRIDVPVLSLSADALTARQAALYYGMVSMQHAEPASYDEWVAAAEKVVTALGLAGPGQHLLMMPPRSTLSQHTAYTLTFHTVAG
ncbi:MAG: pyruvate kinase [Planctomycetaceae bacterium]|nr:pyruvate kinase [Planctomycetaceae bacterium]